ncbi:Golgi apyrase [Sporothrix curviconia]|uniref:Golgi apyrase n=1 Tax=Sporothrix curviconia TaxID=1260050 RepID=A0ABP0BGU9_9PEZI
MSSTGSDDTLPPYPDSLGSSRSSSPIPTLMRGLSFPLQGSDRSASTSPTPSIKSMTETEWLDAVRNRSFQLYRLAQRKPIPMVIPRIIRVPLDVDDDDNGAKIAGEADGDSDSDSDADDNGNDGCLKASTKPEAELAERVSLLFQRLSMSITAHDKTNPAEKEKNGDPEKEVEEETDEETDEEKEGECEPQMTTWKDPGQLEKFLGRCAEGWEMQKRYMVQQKQMLHAMEKMCKRVLAAEDENALLVWYVNHLKGSSTEPITADASASVLQEAQAAVLNIAATSMKAPTASAEEP